jgi:hypothetical protein
MSLRPKDHGPVLDTIRAKYPNLIAYLYDGSWDDLQPRESGKLILRAIGGVLTATLQCPTEGQELKLTGWSWEYLFDALERACGASDTHWLDMRYGTGAQKKKDLRRKELDKRNVVSEDPA